ncbi:MAG TPA: ABC transporter ATP-binding protein [Vicinamibacterales bacterium]|nr:ABC transporter ATP-binding protein [Vicinamibacterales bacterium]
MLRALARLVPYLRRSQRAYIAGLLCTLAATAVSMTSPWILKYVIDGVSQGIGRRQLAVYAAITLALAAADGGFRYLMRTWLIGASRQIEYDLRNAFFAHLERLPLAYFQANRTGDLMSRATNDLGAVRMMVGPAIMYFAGTALGFVIAVSVMLAMDWRLTLIALIPLPAVSVATHYFGSAIHDRFERIQAQLSDLSAVVQEALAGVRVVRAYRQEGAELDRFRRANDEYVARNKGLIRLQSAFFPSLTLCFGLSGLLVLWFGGRDVMSGRLTLGGFVAFGRYLVLLSWPLIAFGWVINIVQRGVASWERMLEIFDAPAVDDAAATERPIALSGALEVRHLTFRYPNAPVNALEDVSLTLAPGRTVAIVGATGAGKSTLVNLLPRLHEPPAGTVFVDGRDVRTLPLANLRRAMGVVPQEPFLFSDTIGGNIAFGVDRDWRSDAGRRLIAHATATAGLTADVEGFTDGLDTVVGERGITLSGGQKQRVAIARALAVDPRILVLDDALSAVDTATEEAILEELRGVRQARSCLIVSHRVSTVRDAHEILVLDQGRVAERGTHDALVAAGGLYADTHKRQLLQAAIEEWT